MKIHYKTIASDCIQLPDVNPNDFVEEVDWSSTRFLFEDAAAWKESLDLCYVAPPTSVFNQHSFVYEPDTVEQIKVKTAAAEEALRFFMSKYDKKYDNGSSNMTHRNMAYSRASYFFCCLRTFHPLTLHLKVKGFVDKYPNVSMYSCPFSRGALNWLTK